MRSTRITLATALGVALALGVCAIPQASFAQSDGPPGSAFQDEGLRTDIGVDAVVVHRSAYAQVGQRTAQVGQRTAQAGQRTQGAQQVSAQASSGTTGLPGYSARPAGMCWERTGGAGQDITSGYWTQCRRH